MKIAAVSDIHVRTFGSDKPLIESIRKRVGDIAPDIFIIAGDGQEAGRDRQAEDPRP